MSLSRGVAGPSLTTSATGHIPKPEGGTRPIGLMAELLKRTEGLAARRVAAAAAAAPPGTFLSGLNSAYQAGQSVDPILGLIRVLMEADSMCDWGLIWLLGDYHKWFDVVRREFIQAKLDALGVAPAISRLISSMYHR